MSYKASELDLMNLFARWNDKRWKAYLSKMVHKKDYKELIRTRFNMQMSMARLSEKMICHDYHVNKYLRWIRLIEVAIRMAYRRVYPNPLDDPKNKNNPHINYSKCLQAKRTRDQLLTEILHRNTF